MSQSAWVSYKYCSPCTEMSAGKNRFQMRPSLNSTFQRQGRDKPFSGHMRRFQRIANKSASGTGQGVEAVIRPEWSAVQTKGFQPLK